MSHPNSEDAPLRDARREIEETGVEPVARDASTGEQSGDTIDRYKLLQELGEGGMGVVWMAQQSEPVRRKVALKVIKLGMDTKEVVVRFEAERQALALMEHPHIAKVLDGGVTASGRPFFVMELVRGTAITEYCDAAKLGLRDRLDLFSKVCEAVQHAHQKGVIHRDIKPGNVLVTLHDGKPVPKVIDFGIAKATSAELTNRTMFTQYQQILGTPEYMAPEQAEMSGLDIDTRADVYALGVLLYELLTGDKPFDLQAVLEAGYAELLRTIREVEPSRPSTRVATRDRTASQTGLASHVNVAELGERLRGDLDWVVMKALEKDRTRRYMTASDLAGDVQRFLRDEPVLAAPPSAAYRFRKLLRRRRKTVIASIAIGIVFVAGSIGTGIGLWQTVVANRALDVALNQETQQRELAQSNERRALAAERAERSRSEELRRVAAFEASKLTGLDVRKTGKQLRRLLMAQLSTEERTSAISLLQRINFTTLGRELLRESILDPSRARIQSEFGSQPLVRATLAESLFSAYEQLDIRDGDLPALRGIYSTYRDELGQDSPRTRTIGLRLMERLLVEDLTNEAERTWAAVRPTLTNVDAPTAIQAIMVEAQLLRIREGSRAAVALLRKELQSLQENPDSPALDRARLTLELVGQLEPQRDREEVERLFSESTRMLTPLTSPSADELRRSLAEQMAAVAKAEGRFAAAIGHTRRQVKLSLDLYGFSAPKSLSALTKLNASLSSLQAEHPRHREELKNPDYEGIIRESCDELRAALATLDVDPMARPVLMLLLATNLTLVNETAEALTVARRLAGQLQTDWIQRTERPEMIATLIGNIGFQLMQNGHLEEADALIEADLAHARASGARVGAGTYNLGCLRMLTGRTEDGLALLREAAFRLVDEYPIDSGHLHGLLLELMPARRRAGLPIDDELLAVIDRLKLSDPEEGPTWCNVIPTLIIAVAEAGPSPAGDRFDDWVRNRVDHMTSALREVGLGNLSTAMRRWFATDYISIWSRSLAAGHNKLGLDLFDKWLSLRRTFLPSDKQLANQLCAGAEWLQKNGHPRQALACYRCLRTIGEAMLPPHHEYNLDVRRAIITTCRDANDASETRTEVAAMLQLLEWQPGKTDAASVFAVTVHGELMIADGKHVEAQPILREAFEASLPVAPSAAVAAGRALDRAQRANGKNVDAESTRMRLARHLYSLGEAAYPALDSCQASAPRHPDAFSTTLLQAFAAVAEQDLDNEQAEPGGRMRGANALALPRVLDASIRVRALRFVREQAPENFLLADRLLTRLIADYERASDDSKAAGANQQRTALRRIKLASNTGEASLRSRLCEELLVDPLRTIADLELLANALERLADQGPGQNSANLQLLARVHRQRNDTDAERRALEQALRYIAPEDAQQRDAIKQRLQSLNQ